MPNRLRNGPLRFLRPALLMLIGATTAAPAEPVRMTFLSPDPDGQFGFWNQTSRFMQAVADDLDIEFNVAATQGISTYAVKKDGRAIIDQDNPPDYLLTGYWNKSVGDLMEASQERGVRLFLFNAPVAEAERSRIGRPRERFAHWIGRIYPDEKEAGYELATLLLERAEALQPNGADSAIEVAALTGDEQSSVSDAREAGLRRAIAEHGAVLNAVVSTSWRRDAAARASESILDEHPDTQVIWTATDAAVLSAIEQAKARGLKPGTDVLTGGFDWSGEGIEAIRRGETVATMGGHFTEGGWAMILAYDHHHGHDFADDPGATLSSPLRAITADNIDRYARLFDSDALEAIDFRELTKTRNPDRRRYDFSPESLLQRENGDT